jgi:hypothetical protein
MFIHTILYVIIFWVLKYLLLPFNAIFHRFTLGRKQKVAYGFSAFDNDPHDISSIYNLESKNIQQNNDSGITPLPTDDQNSQENSDAIYENSENSDKPIDNSIFQPSTQSEAGLFIIKDPEANKKEKAGYH